MLSWDEFDKEEEGEVAVKGANAGHATEANMDRLDAAGGVAAQEARAVTASDSAAIQRAKAALDKLDVAEGLAAPGAHRIARAAQGPDRPRPAAERQQAQAPRRLKLLR